MIESKVRVTIWQVIEALDYGDAVSNQVLALDSTFKDLGVETGIYAKFWHPSLEDRCVALEKLAANETDIVLTHFSLYSENAAPVSLAQRCTRILCYHNITPAPYFAVGSRLRTLCEKGRLQLQEILCNFHRFWGDSQYNLDELVSLGADPSHCTVVPIIVDSEYPAVPNTANRESGVWIFVGRLAPNKAQDALIRTFASVRTVCPDAARHLYLIGSADENDPYVQEVRSTITALQLDRLVTVTGKISDEEVDDFMRRAGVFVSTSEHEGFGVPLIEAALRNLPVLALSRAAIPQTLGGHGVCATVDELQVALREIGTDSELRNLLAHKQAVNAQRFSGKAVRECVVDALRKLVPSLNHFTSVSVVICTYNRDTLLERCLDYLQYQTNANFEVIVVNGPSTDGTDEVLARFADRIVIVRNAERNLSKSRNLGLEAAKGQLVAYIDDDAIPFDDWVDTILSRFNSLPLTYAGIGGPAYYAGSLEFQAQDNGINRYGEAWVNIDPSSVGKNGWRRYPTGTNCCFRADILRSSGGFDEQFDYYLDESELCFRLQERGHFLSYCPDLYLRHEFAQSHNRAGKYNYNWFTICKNTAYFIAAYSGLKGDELRTFLAEKVERPRMDPIVHAGTTGELDQEEVARHVDAIRRGVATGVEDAKCFPRTRTIEGGVGQIQGYAIRMASDFKPLHICIVSREFPPFVKGGGVGTLYYHLASELLLMGHRVSVVAPAGADSTYRRGRFSVQYVLGDEAIEHGPAHAGFVRNLLWSVNVLKRVAEIHSEFPVDVVDSALWDSETLALALLPSQSRPALAVRLVTPFATSLAINGWEVEEHVKRYFEAAEKRLVTLADAVIPISESIANTVVKCHGVPRDARWMRANCGIAYWPFFDVNTGYGAVDGALGQQLEVSKGKRLVVFVGRLEARKGIDLFLLSLDAILSKTADTLAVIAGRDIEGWGQKFKGLVAEEHHERVVFLGEVDDGVREKLLSAAYCLVFPSRYESFGIVPLEGFVHGVPVVATAAGAIPEVVRDQDCGILVPPDDPVALTNAVLRLLDDQTLYQQLRSGARRRVRELSSRNAALQSVEIYRRLLSRRNTLHQGVASAST